MVQLSSKNTLGLALILGSVTAMAPLAIDMYLPSFPQIAQNLRVDTSEVELSLTAFFIGLSTGQLFYGPLSDRFGRRWPLTLGLLLAAIASFLCATADTIEFLIAARFIQALGVCAGMVISRAVVRDMFNHNDAARFFSLLMLIMGVAPILAPLLGGYVAKFFGWHAIFQAIGGFAFLAMAAVLVFLPETKGANAGVRLSRALHTYVDILKNTAYLRYALAGGAANAGMFAYITGSPFVVINYYGVPAEQFGLVFGTNAAGLIGMTQVNRLLLKRYHFDQVLRVGYTLILLSALAAITVALVDGPLVAFLATLFMFLASLGIIMPNSTAGAMSEEGERAGSASALTGSLSFWFAFLSSGTVGFIKADSALPLACVMGACALASMVFSYLPSKTVDKATL